MAISPQYQAVNAVSFGPIHTPYKEPPFDLLPHAPRKIPEDALFHPSVQVYLDAVSRATSRRRLAALSQGRRLDAGLLRA